MNPLSGDPLTPVFIVLVLIALGFGALALIQVVVRKNNPPSRVLTLSLSTIGFLVMIGAGAVFYVMANR